MTLRSYADIITKSIQQRSFLSELDIKTILVGFYFFSTIIFSYWHEIQIRAFFYSSVLLICYFLFHLYKTNERIWFLNKYLMLYYLLFIFCAISFFIGPRLESDVQTITSFFKVVLILFLMSNLVKTQYTLTFILLVISLSSLLLFYLNYDLVLIAGREAKRLYGTYNDPNQLGYVLIVSIWATLSVFFTLESKWKYFLLINLAPSLYMIFLAGSRKVFLALILLPFLLFFSHGRFSFKKGGMNKFFYYGLFCLILISIIAGVAVSPHGKRFKQVGDLVEQGVNLNINRVLYAKAAYKMFIESPFVGKGFNQFRHLVNQYSDPEDKYSHSTILEILANSGIIGFILYFGSLFYLFYGIKECIRLKIPDKDLILLRFGLILILLMLILNIFAVMYFHKLYWPLLAAYTGYLRSLGIREKVEV